MYKKILLGILVISIALISGCVEESPHEKRDVIFNLGEAIVTNELEVRELFTNETKIVTSVESKFVIIPITIENKQNQWLAIQTTPGISGLVDDEGNRYQAEMFIEANGKTYSVEEISLIGEEETFGFGTDIRPNSTELKKAVFTIPIDREPKKLKLDYGFHPNKEAEIEDWFEIELEVSS